MREMQAPFAAFPADSVIALLDSTIDSGRLTAAEIDRLAIPRKTLAHRRTLGSLTAEQADRVDRLLRMVGLAEETFANPEKAARWLRRPTRPLGDQAPIDLLGTDRGCRVVEDLLDRIAHGIAA